MRRHPRSATFPRTFCLGLNLPLGGSAAGHLRRSALIPSFLRGRTSPGEPSNRKHSRIRGPVPFERSPLVEQQVPRIQHHNGNQGPCFVRFAKSKVP
jgi:hypothetical protein